MKDKEAYPKKKEDPCAKYSVSRFVIHSISC